MKKPFELSSDQRRAVEDPSRKILVEAAAGSGKTTVIVAKFAAAAAAGTPPGRIACITYTEKAAAHLKSKLAEWFEQAGLEKQLEQLPDAYVSTIHGFCRRLLKEFAIDAGVDPSFGVLDEDVARLLRSEAAAKAFEKISVSDEGRRLLEDFALADLEKSLHKLYGRWRSSPGSPRVESRAPEFASRVREIEDAWRGAGQNGKPELPDVAEAARGGEAAERAFEELGRAWGAAGTASGKKKESVQAYQETVSALVAELADALSQPYARGFAALLEAFEEEYARSKRERAALDFDDLVRETVAVLKRDARLRLRAASAFDLVLVDEYQDVNPLQAELLALVSVSAQSFYVGDVRQSIYAFRHADCREFIKAARDRDRKTHPLAENRRSVPHVLEFVNGLFDGETVTEDYPYGKMKPVRAEIKSPEVRVLAVDQAMTETKADEARHLEAHTIASELVALDAKERGGAAILLRSRTGLHIYENALKRAGIRYRVAKGKDFYHKTEIEDALAALRALDDPSDDLHFAALLKSPFCGASDDALYLVRKKWSDTSLCEAARLAAADGAGFFEADLAAMRRLFVWFDRLSSEKRRLAPDRVLARMLAASAYDAAILAAEDGDRRYANLRKLQDKAAAYARTEGPDLNRFVRFVEELVFEETDESEAQIEDEKSDAVTIMTVHASKGLEFPTVFIADMGKNRDAGSRADGAGFLLTDSLQILAPAPFEYRGKKTRGVRYAAVKDELESREREESRRLFYVALTRAENRIYLCGALRKKPAEEEKSWMDFIESNLPFLREGEGGVWNGVPVKLVPPSVTEASVAHGASGGASERLDRLARAMDAGSAPAKSKAAVAAAARAAHTDKGYFQTLDLRVTEFLESSAAAASSRRPAARRAASETDEGRLPAAEYGTLYHRMLQYADFGADADGQLDALFAAVAPHLDEATRKRMGDGFCKFFDSSRGKALARAAARKKPVYRELPFLFRVAGGEDARDLGFLSGQADLLHYDEQAKGWVVVDYKTGRRSDSHRDQLLIYAHCLGKLLDAPIRSAEIFYAEDGKLEPVDLSALEEPGFGESLSRRYADLRAKELERLERLSLAGFDMLK